MFRRVDFTLPYVPEEELVCPGCNQPFETIRGDHRNLPDRHWLPGAIAIMHFEAAKRYGYTPLGRMPSGMWRCLATGPVGTRAGQDYRRACAWTGDHLARHVLREQYRRAGLALPRRRQGAAA